MFASTSKCFIPAILLLQLQHYPTPLNRRGCLAGNHWFIFFSLPVFFPSSYTDSFEVGSCIESLDLYFLKFVTYFLVVCMSCIFNKTLWVNFVSVAAGNIKGTAFSSLTLFLFSLLHSSAFSSPFPCFRCLNSILWWLLTTTMREMWRKEDKIHCCCGCWFNTFYQHLAY